MFDAVNADRLMRDLHQIQSTERAQRREKEKHRQHLILHELRRISEHEAVVRSSDVWLFV